MRQAIADALTRTRRANIQLSQKLQVLQATMQEKKNPTESASFFWTIPPNTFGGIIFSPEPDKNLMVSLGLESEYEALDPDSPHEDLFEHKIEEIRAALPAYPSIPDRDAPRLPPIETKQPKASQTKIGGSKIPLTRFIGSKGQIQQPLPPKSALAPPPNPSLLQVPMDSSKTPTPSLSPSKSSHSMRRRSVRFSTARRRTGRPSIFRLFNGALEDEIDKACGLPFASI
jgi:hypothetical protein